MIILGIDPGLRKTGYGLIKAEKPNSIFFVEAGVINTSEKNSISKRVSDIYENVIDIINEFNPDVLVLEKLYSHYKHPITSVLMAHARGVICLACGIKKIRLISYPATRVKKSLTGNGRAKKEQVQLVVKSILNLKKNPAFFDVTDALAMAITYIYVEGIVPQCISISN